MRKSTLAFMGCILGISVSAFAQDAPQARWATPRAEVHPVLSFGVTEVVISDRRSDTFLLELRGFKNLHKGLTVGGKLASNFDDEAEFGLSFRKTLIETFYAYSDLGYSDMDSDDGTFAELGVGAYFWKHNIIGINGGVKHYMGPSDTAFTVGFTINIY